MLRKSIRAFVEKEVTPHVREWEDAGRIPRSLWRRLGELGFLGLEFPTEHGGGGGDFLSSVVLGEEMARCRSGGVAFSVLVHTDMSSPWLTRFGTEAQKRRYLPRIIAGELVCALAITEPGTGSDMAALSTRAERRADHYVLTGGKLFITNGVYGDLYFVAARTAPGTPGRRHDGISMFLVERGLPGFSVSRKLDKMGMRASSASASWRPCSRSPGPRRRSRTRSRTCASGRPSASRSPPGRRCATAWPTSRPTSRPRARSSTTPRRSTPAARSA